MTSQTEKLIDELRDKLVDKSYSFIIDYLYNENKNSLVSIILSAHLTSAFDLMKSIAKDDDLLLDTVNKFIVNLIRYIQTISDQFNYMDKDE